MLAFIPPVFAFTVFVAIVIISGSDTNRYEITGEQRTQSAEILFASLSEQISYNQTYLGSLDNSEGPSGVMDITSTISVPYPYVGLNNFKFTRTSTRVGDGGQQAFLIISTPVASSENAGSTGLTDQSDALSFNDAERLRRFVRSTFRNDLVDSGIVSFNGTSHVIGAQQFNHMSSYLSPGDLAFVVSLEEEVAL